MRWRAEYSPGRGEHREGLPGVRLGSEGAGRDASELERLHARVVRVELAELLDTEVGAGPRQHVREE